MNFGGLGCRRAEDIPQPSFLASMNSVGELVETILSRINIADTNEFAEVVESWRGASGDALLPDDPSRQKAWDLPFVERNWENMLRVTDQVCRARLLATAQRERERAALGSMLCRFRRLGHFWTPRVLGLPLHLKWAQMFVFLILAVEAGGWTVGVCMVCPADTVLAAFQGIRQWMMWLRERFKKPACHQFWSILCYIEGTGHPLTA